MMNHPKFCSMLCMMTCLMGNIAIGPGILTPTPAVAGTPEAAIAKRVYARANPAVVTIRGNDGWGSGFIISGNYIVTNAHVVKGQPAVVTVMMADGKTEIPADLVGFAKGGIDLALLKINRRIKLPTVQLGNVKSISVGDSVYAIGTPLAEVNQNTFTSGMVSALRNDGRRIQHNAAINRGNSGGPLLNDRGEVIGVNTSGSLSQVIDEKGKIVAIGTGSVGIGYAIGADVVRQFLTDAKQGKISPVATINR